MEDVDDLLERLLGLILTGHIPEGDAGLFLHIDLGIGLAYAADAADAAHSALSAHAAEQEEHQAHHHHQRQDVGQEQAEQIGRAVHRLSVGYVCVLLQQSRELAVFHSGQRHSNILHILRLLGRGNEGVHPAFTLAALLLGQFHRHPFPQGKGVLAGLHVDLFDLVLYQPLLEGGVGHLNRVRIFIGRLAAAQQNGKKQCPEDNTDQTDHIAFVVSVVIVFFWLQMRIPPSLVGTKKWGTRAFRPGSSQIRSDYYTTLFL